MPLTKRQYGSNDNARNMQPHAEAVAAMTIWGAEYGRQSLGCMDWGDALPAARKRVVVEMLNRCAGCPRADKQ